MPLTWTPDPATVPWHDVQADEVIRFVPNPANTKDWTLRVTAHCADALTGAAQDFTADFILRVWANFDPGRDALKEAVNARRR